MSSKIPRKGSFFWVFTAFHGIIDISIASLYKPSTCSIYSSGYSGKEETVKGETEIQNRWEEKRIVSRNFKNRFLIWCKMSIVFEYTVGKSCTRGQQMASVKIYPFKDGSIFFIKSEPVLASVRTRTWGRTTIIRWQYQTLNLLITFVETLHLSHSTYIVRHLHWRR